MVDAQRAELSLSGCALRPLPPRAQLPVLQGHSFFLKHHEAIELKPSQDCGYYYEEYNLTQAVEQTLRAITEHDSHIEEYNKKADECVWRFHVDNPDNIRAYDQLLQELTALPDHVFADDEIALLKQNIPPEAPAT